MCLIHSCRRYNGTKTTTHMHANRNCFYPEGRIFCRAWQSLQDCSTCQAVVVLYKNSCLMHMGSARSGHNPEDALPGPICKRSMSCEQGNYLANLALYPGRCCYTTMHPSLLPCLRPPLPCACSWLCSCHACGICYCHQSSTSWGPSSRFVSKNMVFQPVSTSLCFMQYQWCVLRHMTSLLLLLSVVLIWSNDTSF